MSGNGGRVRVLQALQQTSLNRLQEECPMSTHAPIYDFGIVLEPLLPYLNKSAIELFPDIYALSPETKAICHFSNDKFIKMQSLKNFLSSLMILSTILRCMRFSSKILVRITFGAFHVSKGKYIPLLMCLRIIRSRRPTICLE